MTDAEYLAWLEDAAAERVILLETAANSGNVEVSRYISSREFISRSTDTPASTYYEPILIGGLRVQESLSIDGQSYTYSDGDIELLNTDGEFDSWLSDVWDRRAITAYLGDVNWPKSDFKLIYTGLIARCEPSGRDRIVLRMGDKMSRLDTFMSEAKGGVAPNTDALLPLCFGECHNVTPLLTNAGTLEYAVHTAEPIEDIIEVRDNGVPVSFTKNLASGRFNLLQSPVGTVTATVQGAKPAAFGSIYYNKVADLISIIVRGWGRTDQRFTVGEMDVTNFSNFAVSNPQPVGLYLTDSTTVRDACEMIASSIGAKMVLTRAGTLRLIQITLPPVSTTTITEEDYKVESFKIAQRSEVRAATKVAYCKNWTVQGDIPSGILAHHKQLFAQEWLTRTASNATIAAKYRQSIDVEQEETLLLQQTDADAEATRRHNLRSVQRNVYEFEAFAPALLLELGAGVTIFSSRFGLSAGVVGQVVSLDIDWIKGRVLVGVLV